MRVILLLIAALVAAPATAFETCSNPYLNEPLLLEETGNTLRLCAPEGGERCIELFLDIDDGTNRVYSAIQTVVDSHGNEWTTKIEAIVTRLPDGSVKLNGTRYLDGEILGNAPELTCE